MVVRVKRSLAECLDADELDSGLYDNMYTGNNG